MAVYKKFFLTCSLMIGLVMLFFAAIPSVIYQIFHTGVIFLGLVGLVLVLIPLLWNKMRSKNQKIIRNILVVGVVLAIVGGLVLSVMMIVKAYFNPPPKEQPVTVIVLGCKVQGDSPSLMLQNRLDAAYGYLLFNEQATCIVAGGLGENERYTEAAVMEKYLLEKGIAQERIFKENKSTNTEENIGFSSEIIQREGLSSEVAIATDSFHQLRAGIFASRDGLTASALPAKTPWGLFPSYWVREFFGIMKAIIIP